MQGSEGRTRGEDTGEDRMTKSVAIPSREEEEDEMEEEDSLIEVSLALAALEWNTLLL